MAALSGRKTVQFCEYNFDGGVCKNNGLCLGPYIALDAALYVVVRRLLIANSIINVILNAKIKCVDSFQMVLRGGCAVQKIKYSLD